MPRGVFWWIGGSPLPLIKGANRVTKINAEVGKADKLYRKRTISTPQYCHPLTYPEVQEERRNNEISNELDSKSSEYTNVQDTMWADASSSLSSLWLDRCFRVDHLLLVCFRIQVTPNKMCMVWYCIFYKTFKGLLNLFHLVSFWNKYLRLLN